MNAQLGQPLWPDSADSDDTSTVGWRIFPAAVGHVDQQSFTSEQPAKPLFFHTSLMECGTLIAETGGDHGNQCLSGAENKI